jgi:uncharacterized phage protein gp47/JayE
MMPPTFKTQQVIFTDMKTSIQTELPDVTNWGPSGKLKAILAVVAAAMRQLYVILQSFWFNMFPQDADLETLQRYYELWGLTWDNPTIEVARMTVLNKYRETSVIGTKGWYEATVLYQFPQVTHATLMPNHRGPGTADLLVSRNNLPLYESDVTEIQAYFDAAGNKVLGMDLLVRTLEEQSGGSV